MTTTRATTIFLLALLAGGSFCLAAWSHWHGPMIVAWKGAGVALLAIWAAANARGTDGWLIAGVLALGATGDVLLEVAGLTVGALAFVAGHLLAILLYLRHLRPAPGKARWLAWPILVTIPLVAFLLPDHRDSAPGIAFYASGLAGMAAAAWSARFPRRWVAFGALLFAASDLLIFARLGPLAESPLPSLLVWPLYFAGQAMIAYGVVHSLAAKELRA